MLATKTLEFLRFFERNILITIGDTFLKKQDSKRDFLGACDLNRFEIILALAQELKTIKVGLFIVEVKKSSL